MIKEKFDVVVFKMELFIENESFHVKLQRLLPSIVFKRFMLSTIASLYIHNSNNIIF